MLRSALLLLPLLLLLLLLQTSSARVVFGPETGRDRLHRLMHADGADLEAEDAAAKIEHDRADRRAQKGKAAPMDQEEFLHGVGMHGDRSKTEYEPQEKEKASDGQKNGPCEGMDCLHGVLMHGDKNRGEAHDAQHAEAARRAEAKAKRDQQPPSVEDPHEMIHGHRKSIAETDADNRRYNKHRPEGEKKPLREPLRLVFEPEQDSQETSYWQAIKKFFRRLLEGPQEEEEEEVRGEDMDMRHDLESIGRTGPVENAHSHGKKSRRQEREEHKTNAHREH